MKLLAWIFLMLIPIVLGAEVSSLKKGPEEALFLDKDSFYDSKFDYSQFSGRVTDRDDTTSIVKISSENKNIKFFRAGDLVEFKMQNSAGKGLCNGFVRSIEENYFIMFIKDLSSCFRQEDYLRRGTVLVMQSDKLAMRVREASAYRAGLLNKKNDFLMQLSGINNDVWNFEEKKIQLAAEFDKKINELEEQKMHGLDQLLSHKNDQIKLQRELAYRLDNIDKELSFYRIDREDLLFDRWHQDQDLGLPVYNKPEKMRVRRANGETTIE